jgi:valyl-tRNA synthetase
MAVTGRVQLIEAAALTTAAGVAGAARTAGRTVDWRLALDAAGAPTQRQLERELVREGLDRATAGKAAFVERWHEFVGQGTDATLALLADLGLTPEIDHLDGTEPVRAARTAFVRLYEEGRLRREEDVVATCPRCESILDAVPANAPVNQTARLTLTISLEDPPSVTVEIDTVAPELLPGVAAILVPEGHPGASGKAEVPIAERYVPVLGGDVAAPVLLVPAHSRPDWEAARALGLAPIEVLDGDGVVRAPGQLEGLSRYAAREAATRLLEVAGLVTGRGTGDETVWLCQVCGTGSIPRLGRHWFLALGELEVAAADALREGVVAFHPSAVGQQVVAAAGERRLWCLSSRAWTGLAVPVSTCLDCGRPSVGVDLDESCPTCMGALVGDEEVIDPGFVAALWPLVAAGWPSRREMDTAATTAAVAASIDIGSWVLPSAALGYALTGSIPFDHLVVVPDSAIDGGLEDAAEAMERDGRTATRSRLAAAADPVLALLTDSFGGG